MILAGLEWHNPNLSPAVFHLTLVTLLLSIISAAANAHAARKGLLELAPLMLSASVLSSVYVIGYGLLAFTDVNPADWSVWMRVPALVSWALVWAWPACLSLKLKAKMQHVVDRKRHHIEGS